MFNSFPAPKPDSGGSGIKNIQRGFANLTALPAIVNIPTPVDLSKSTLEFYMVSDNASQVAMFTVLGKFISNSQLQFESVATSGENHKVIWQVTEYNNVKSLQSGQVTISSGTNGILNTATATINAVNPAKTKIIASHKSSATTTTNIYNASGGAELTNATTVTCYALWLTGATITFEYRVIEFM